MTFAGVRKALSGSTFYGCFGWTPMRKLSSKQNKKTERRNIFQIAVCDRQCTTQCAPAYHRFFPRKKLVKSQFDIKNGTTQPAQVTPISTHRPNNFNHQKKKNKFQLVFLVQNKFYKKTKMCAKKENKVTPRKKLHQKTSRKICQKRKEKILTKEKTRKIYLKQKNIMTKVKIPPEDRIYDRDGYWLRAACVCVKDHSENEVRF